MGRTHEHNIRITEPITLGDLRWLVGECTGLDDKSPVEVEEHKSYNPHEFDVASITVIGK